MHMLAQVYLKQGKTKDVRKYIRQTKVRDLINLTMMPILNWVHPSEFLVEVYLNIKDLEMAEEHFCHYVDEIIETLRLSQDNFVIPFFKINVYRIVTENPLYQPLLERPACREKLKKLCKLSEKENQ